MTAKRILILMSNTGGGHRASALALQAGFARDFPERFHIDIVDLLVEHTFWPLNHAPQIYGAIAVRMPWLWGAAYATEKSPRFVRGLMGLAARLAAAGIRSAVDAHQPDLVISVHPLAQDLTLPDLARRPLRIPFVTVVTDLATVHPLWLHPGVDACFVAGEEGRRAARAAGLREVQIHALGLPIRPTFELDYPPRALLKSKLGLLPDLPAALLMGGGDGVGPVEEIATAVARSLSSGASPTGQMVVICGRNDDLRGRLEQRTWPIPTQIRGFVDAMPEWMNAADCLVTKAGPGTIAEAMICGLPVILSGFIPGQEEGNVPYVVGHQAGAFVPEPDAIGRTVQEWFGSRAAQRSEMAENARALGRPHATRDIVAVIAAMLEGDR